MNACDGDIDEYESDEYIISDISFAESGFGLVDIFDLIGSNCDQKNVV